MALYSPSYRHMPVFKDATINKCTTEEDRKAMTKALGHLVIRAAEFYTCDIGVFVLDGELVYIISRYGTKELLIIHDKDLPNLEIPEDYSELLPPGLRKAVTISGQIHKEITSSLGLADDESENDGCYTPPNPYTEILRQRGNWFSPLIFATVDNFNRFIADPIRRIFSR